MSAVDQFLPNIKQSIIDDPARNVAVVKKLFGISECYLVAKFDLTDNDNNPVNGILLRALVANIMIHGDEQSLIYAFYRFPRTFMSAFISHAEFCQYGPIIEILKYDLLKTIAMVQNSNESKNDKLRTIKFLCA